MAQYRFGKATLAHAARTVSFIGAELAGNVTPGNLFSIQGENVWYEIVAVDVAASTVTLNSDYAGPDRAEADYAIHRDFTATQRLPTLSYGDQNTAGLLQLTFTSIDASLKTLGASGGALSGIVSPTFTLQRGLTGEPVDNAGLIIERGDRPSVSFLWDELAELWTLGEQGLTGITTLTASGAISAGSLTVGAITASGVVTAPGFSGPLTGNAQSATKLQNARKIALSGAASALGVAFDGTGDIALTVTDLDAAKLSSGIVPSARLSGTYAVSVTGNAATATKLQTARSFSLTGAATAAATAFDGSADIALNVTALDATKLTGLIAAARLSGIYGIDVTGNAATATKLATSRTLSVTGDATGSASFDGSADKSIALTLANSGVVAGSYSNITVDAKGRVTGIAALSAANITTALGFTPLSNTGGVITGNLTVTGDLTVQGDTITLDVGTVRVEDAIIEVAKANSSASLPYGGLKMERGGSDAFFVWNEATDRWTAYLSGDDLATAGTKADLEAANLYVTGISATNISATTFTGALTGNADTATKLKTARTINGVSFDGSANISFGTDAVAEGPTNKYYTDARARAALSVTGTGLSYDVATGKFTSNATSVNTVSTIVARDASGNFSAGTITAALAGNASSATKLQTARKINGTLFDGSADIAFTTDAVAEGAANLYYTEARATAAARAAIKPGAGITYDAATGTITNTFASAAVTSVAGRTGDVTLTSTDITDWTTAVDNRLSGKANLTGAAFTGSVTFELDVLHGKAASPAATYYNYWSYTDKLNFAKAGSGTFMSVDAARVVTFDARPLFGTATPWDSINLPSPLQTTGGTLTGDLTFSDNLEGLIFSSGGRLRDQNSSGVNNVGRTVLTAANSSFDVVNFNGTVHLAQINSNGAVLPINVVTPQLKLTTPATGQAIPLMFHRGDAVAANLRMSFALESDNSLSFYAYNTDGSLKGVMASFNPDGGANFAGSLSIGSPSGLSIRKPTSGSTLAGNVVMAVSGNSLLFYENGGSYRGVFVDLTKCGSQSEIWHTGTFNPATKFDKTGGTLTGDLAISKGAGSTAWIYFDNVLALARNGVGSAMVLGADRMADFPVGARSPLVQATSALWTYGVNGSNTQGILYMGSSGGAYIHWNTSYFNFTHGINAPSILRGGNTVWDAANLPGPITAGNFTNYFGLRKTSWGQQGAYAPGEWTGGIQGPTGAFLTSIYITTSMYHYGYYNTLQWLWNGTWYTTI